MHMPLTCVHRNTTLIVTEVIYGGACRNSERQLYCIKLLCMYSSYFLPVSHLYSVRQKTKFYCKTGPSIASLCIVSSMNNPFFPKNHCWYAFLGHMMQLSITSNA